MTRYRTDLPTWRYLLRTAELVPLGLEIVVLGGRDSWLPWNARRHSSPPGTGSCGGLT